MAWRTLAVLVAMCCTMLEAQAHNRAEFYSTWNIVPSQEADSTTHTVSIELRFRVATADKLAAVFGMQWRDHLPGKFAEQTYMGPSCVVTDTPEFRYLAHIGLVRYRWSQTCDSAPTQLHDNAFFADVDGLLHIARVRNDGALSGEYLLTGQRTLVELNQPDSASTIDQRGTSTTFASQISNFALAGWGHVLSGVDHLVFLLLLTSLAHSWRRLVLAVTGFTIGHALSIVLLASGALKVRSLEVELLIAASLLLLAGEFAMRHTKSTLEKQHIGALVLAMSLLTVAIHPSAGLAMLGFALLTTGYLALQTRSNTPGINLTITCLFGIVHGMGFGSALLELELQRESLLPATLGFNLGIEAGQLAIVVVALGLRSLYRRLVLTTTHDLMQRALHSAPAIFVLLSAGGASAFLLARAAG